MPLRKRHRAPLGAPSGAIGRRCGIEGPRDLDRGRGVLRRGASGLPDTAGDHHDQPGNQVTCRQQFAQCSCHRQRSAGISVRACQDAGRGRPGAPDGGRGGRVEGGLPGGGGGGLNPGVPQESQLDRLAYHGRLRKWASQ